MVDNARPKCHRKPLSTSQDAGMKEVCRAQEMGDEPGLGTGTRKPAQSQILQRLQGHNSSREPS